MYFLLVFQKCRRVLPRPQLSDTIEWCIDTSGLYISASFPWSSELMREMTAKLGQAEHPSPSCSSGCFGISGDYTSILP